MLQITLTPDQIAGWRLAIEGELMLSHVAGTYADLASALDAIDQRGEQFEHSAELARERPA